MCTVDYAVGVALYFQGYPDDGSLKGGEWRGYIAAKWEATPAERRQHEGAAEDSYDNQPGYSENRQLSLTGA